ncbi:hypothetical protein GCM10023067_53950 [Aminobacter aganoensis]
MNGLLGLDTLGRSGDGLGEKFKLLLHAAARDAQRAATMKRLGETSSLQVAPGVELGLTADDDSRPRDPRMPAQGTDLPPLPGAEPDCGIPLQRAKS